MPLCARNVFVSYKACSLLLVFTVNVSVKHYNNMNGKCIYCIYMGKVHGKSLFLRNNHSFDLFFEQMLSRLKILARGHNEEF